MFPFGEESLQWRGTNFHELYEWLTNNSTTKNFKLRVIQPGNKRSTIEVTIDSVTLSLNVDDWIVKNPAGIYYVVEDDE